MNHQLDELTKSLAQAVTRRVALKKFGLGLAGMALACLGGLTAQGSLVVAPGAESTIEGNTSNIIPLGAGFVRFQQVYGASEFAALGLPVLITQIAFRPDRDAGHAFTSTWNDVHVHLSTTPMLPDGLSTTFANNIGADETEVFSGTWVHSSLFTGPTGGPKDFDIILTLTTPFLYNPANGNLLLDMLHYDYANDGFTSTDSQTVAGDGVSRVYAYGIGIGNGTTGGADSLGTVTQFTVAPVPEPTSSVAGALLLLPLALTSIRALRSRDRIAPVGLAATR